MSKEQNKETQNKLSDLSLLAHQTLPLDTKLYIPTDDKIEIHLYRELLRTEAWPETKCFFNWEDAEKTWVREHNGKPYPEN